MNTPARLLALLAVWITVAAAVVRPAAAQLILDGQVVDDVTRQPLAGARVWLLNRHNRVSDYAAADETGRFRFERSGTGWYRLEVRAVGYQSAVTTPLWMLERSIAGIEVRLSPNAVLLAPVEVVALSPLGPSPVLENMMHRRTRGFGHQITRQDIEARRPGTITDMLMEVPGVYASRTGGGRGVRQIYMGRALLGPGGGECPVQVFLDGVQVSRDPRGGDTPIDDLVNPLDVEAIEVFRGLGSIPPEFLTPEARCGVVAIWARRGPG
jgi:hypothetical protein